MRKIHKRFIALFAATILVLGPTTSVMAMQTNLDSSTEEGSTTISYIDPTTIIKVTAPTSESLKLTLDPQNLANIQGVGEWKPEDGGSILPNAVGIFVNKSAFPVKSNVSFSVTDTSEVPITIVENNTNINAGVTKNFHLTITPSTKKASIDADEIEAATEFTFVGGQTPTVYTLATLTAAGLTSDIVDFDDIAALDSEEAFGKFLETADGSGTYNQVEIAKHDLIAETEQTTIKEFSDTMKYDTSYAMTSSGLGMSYILKSAAHYVTKTQNGYELTLRQADTNTNYDTGSFIIGGSINKNADWSGYDETKKITLSAVYTFEAMSEPDATAGLAEKFEDSYNSVAYVAPVDPVIPSISTTTYALAADTPVEVAVALGEGTSAATGIASVKFEDTAIDATGNYTFADGKITFTNNFVNSFIASEDSTRNYVVTFNNAEATTVTLTFNYTAPVVNAAPTIASNTANFSKATGSTITVNLGSGNLAAIGIEKVDTIVSGTAYPWTTGYSLSGNTLTFSTSAPINAVTAEQTRTVRITFNDTAKTVVELTVTIKN